MKLTTLILNAITTADNQAIDVIRVGMVLSGLALIVLTAVAILVNHQPFDPLAFGSGLAVIFAGGGVGVMAKSKDENPSG